MKNIDKRITQNLTEEERQLFDKLDEQNMLEMVLGLFKGKNKYIMYMMNIMTLVFFVLFVYCVVHFFRAESIFDMLKWSVGSIIFLIGVSMLKIFAWMQMDKNAIFRELKKLQLQVSSLSGRITN